MKGFFCANSEMKNLKSYVRLKYTCIRAKVCTVEIKSSANTPVLILILVICCLLLATFEKDKGKDGSKK